MSYGLKSAIITPNPSEYYSEVTDDNDKGPEERDLNTCYVWGLTSHGQVKQFSTSGLHDLLTFQPCFSRTLPLLFVSDVGLFGTSKTIDLLVKLTDVNLQSRLEFVLGNLGGATFARTVRDDDIVDQLHHHVMTTSLLVLGMTVAGQQFMGNPINCWIPAQYDVDDSGYQDYVDSYCWISHMYNVPFTEDLPLHIEDRLADDKDISFYRWVVIMMFFQAFLFWLPRLLWKTCSSFCGLNIEKVINMALQAQLLNDETRKEKMSNISAVVDRWLGTFRKAETKPLWKFLQTLKQMVLIDKRSGNYLTRQNLFTKLLYLVNVVCQFELLSSFLGTNYWRYGTDVLAMLAADSFWNDESNFPRVGMCDFEIRQLQNIQRHTVQCALPINLFLEKIYVLQWFVIAGLSLLTAVSLVSAVVFTYRRDQVMDQYAVLLDKTLKEKVDRGLFKTFVEKYLRDDGAFLVRTVGNNTSEILAFDLLTQLWSKFKDTVPEIKRSTSEGHLSLSKPEETN